MNFGWTIDHQTAFDLLDTYRAAGGAFLQSIHVSGDLTLLPDTFKAPEAWIGDWMRTRSIPRDELVLSSRVTLLDDKHTSRKPLLPALKHCCETLLKRMRIAYLDLLILEWNPRLLPADEAALAFSAIKRTGLVRHLSIANAPNWRVMESLAFSSSNPGIEGLQTGFSVQSHPNFRTDTLTLSNSYDLGLTVTSTLGGGHMRLRNPSYDNTRYHYAGHHDHLLRLLSTVTAQRKGSIEQVALAWVLSHKAVSSVVTSVNTPDQLTELITAASWHLSSVSPLQPVSFHDSDAVHFSRAPRLMRFPNPKITR